MYLKYRYGLGYETLVREVADSFSWRRFCRIALDARVPDATTLIKLTNRLGPGLVEELNAELLRVAVERRVLRSRRLRVDSTVVESDTQYPTDSGLCAHAVSRLTAAAAAVHEAGLAPRSRVRDRRRGVAKRVRWISAALRRVGRSRGAVDALTAEIAQRATKTAREARRVLRNAARAVRGSTRGGAARSRGWRVSSRPPSRSWRRPGGGLRASGRSRIGASRWSTPMRGPYPAASVTGRTSSATRRASPTPPRAS